MYTLKQTSIFQDTIKLEKADGTSEILNIQFAITPDMVKQYRALQVQVIDLQRAQQKNPEDAGLPAEIGKAVVNIFSLLFGKENCQKIMGFYSDDFTQMAVELFPYIQDRIVPHFQRLARERQQALKRKWRK